MSPSRHIPCELLVLAAGLCPHRGPCMGSPGTGSGWDGARSHLWEWGDPGRAGPRASLVSPASYPSRESRPPTSPGLTPGE